MRYLSFAMFVYMLTALAYAGPQDKWVYAGSSTQLDGIALLLAVAAFVWVYLIYRDFRVSKKTKGK